MSVRRWRSLVKRGPGRGAIEYRLWSPSTTR